MTMYVTAWKFRKDKKIIVNFSISVACWCSCCLFGALSISQFGWKIRYNDWKVLNEMIEYNTGQCRWLNISGNDLSHTELSQSTLNVWHKGLKLNYTSRKNIFINKKLLGHFCIEADQWETVLHLVEITLSC